ncbi:MAG: YfhO family protein [Planctomycetia bacterium]
MFGPFQPASAWRDLAGAHLHAGAAVVVLWCLGTLLRTPGGRWRAWVAPAVLAATAVDLYAATGWLVQSDTQASVDAVPPALTAILDQEAKEAAETNGKIDAGGPPPGLSQPYRLYRTRIYNPINMSQTSEWDRYTRLTRWERATLQPKYAIQYGSSYSHTVGTMAMYDTEFFFGPWTFRTPDALRTGRREAPATMVYFPRQGFNLWNTKYFILPKLMALDHEDRGFFTLLFNADGNVSPGLYESPGDKDDVQVVRNVEALPRCWLVHQADFRPTLRDLRRASRLVPMEQLLYRSLDGGLPIWRSERHRDYPIRRVVMIEADDPSPFAEFNVGGPPQRDERAWVEEYRSDRVVLKVSQKSAGFVVLADTFYPGWTATVDGAPVPILRANRAMRAVPTPAGDHEIVFTYRCRSLEVGAAISAAAWLAVLVFVGVGLFRGRK